MAPLTKRYWKRIGFPIALIIIPEMCARMGAVSSKGLSDLIWEHFGARIVGDYTNGRSSTGSPGRPRSSSASCR